MRDVGHSGCFKRKGGWGVGAGQGVSCGAGCRLVGMFRAGRGIGLGSLGVFHAGQGVSCKTECFVRKIGVGCRPLGVFP